MNEKNVSKDQIQAALKNAKEVAMAMVRAEGELRALGHLEDWQRFHEWVQLLARGPIGNSVLADLAREGEMSQDSARLAQAVGLAAALLLELAAMTDGADDTDIGEKGAAV